MTRARRVLPGLVSLLVGALVIGCSGPTGSSSPSAPVVAVPTAAVASFSPAVDGARAVVAARLSVAGFRLEPPVVRYEPGQPGTLEETPRAVYRINLIDPNQGWVVIYDLGNVDAATSAGTEFASYLRTFGHSNYPGDAQFTLNVVDAALIYHWWSAQRSSDSERARAAFAVVSGIGQPVEVIN